MHKEIRDLWVTALKSGDYKRCEGQLRTLNDEFCPLGVLCDLAVKAGVLDEPEALHGDFFNGYRYDGDAVFLPEPVRYWAGLYRSPIKIIHLNDDGASFNRTANWIEANL